jgi:predicted nucleic acid-binding protein
MITGAESVFIDTNVLVFANAVEAPHHETALSTIKECRQAGIELWISQQVLREYLAVRSRQQTFVEPMDAATLVERVQYFRSAFRVAQDSREVLDKLLNVMQETNFGGKQIHDANIVATMLVHGVSHLLTNNVTDFKRFSGRIKVVPLVESPADVSEA